MWLIVVILGMFVVGCGEIEEAGSEFQNYVAGTHFPVGPDRSLTPGSTCASPNRYRFPERIAYCNRNVSSRTKNEIIAEYDKIFGFTIRRMNRREFKIDHYISLCIGGSNRDDNLWPQHRSVYQVTDPIEHKLCRLLSGGKIEQSYAIATMRAAKANLEEAREIDIRLDEMLSRLF